MSAKHIADQLAALRNEVRNMQLTQKTHHHELERISTTLENLVDGAEAVAETMSMLDQGLQQVLERVWHAEDRLQVLGEEFEEFRNAYASASAESAGPAGPDGETDVNRVPAKKMRNALQTVVRTCLHELMGITKNTNLPEPLAAGRFWTHDDPNDPDRLLRPRWDEWNENKLVWLREMQVQENHV
ncbi:hypothetical protein B0H21DRAFT_708137 [Amylocystis lapponica]|nr:hypothetical protein B0H21DRAFT_708137 [Amylocystis lapponica]